MQFVRLPAEEAAVRRFIEDLWLPFYRELESTVDQFALADSVDILAEELPFRLDRPRDRTGHRPRRPGQRMGPGKRL